MSEIDDGKRLAAMLDLAYRQRVLRQNVTPDSVLVDDAAFKAAVEAELARINGLGLGANLASRDFATYQQKLALEAALAKLKEKDNAPKT